MSKRMVGSPISWRVIILAIVVAVVLLLAFVLPARADGPAVTVDGWVELLQGPDAPMEFGRGNAWSKVYVPAGFWINYNVFIQNVGESPSENPIIYLRLPFEAVRVMEIKGVGRMDSSGQ